ncbi:MAG: hypothetical protein F6J97_23045 [Leptolyngbya sp. SIO4C1]|nr:hypothetical protein [Leptolyngbya sp. SIO4C1]
MFQYSGSGAGAPPASRDYSPRFEEVCLSITGSKAALRKTIQTLHKLRYAEPNDWSKPQPRGEQWVTVLIRRLQIE